MKQDKKRRAGFPALLQTPEAKFQPGYFLLVVAGPAYA
jgi:hypothetical protein